MSTALLLFSALVLSVAPDGEASAAPTDDQVRQAVQLSLPVIEKGAIEWRDNRKCVTCHRLAVGIWANNEAKRHGLTINEPVVAQLTEWSLEFCGTNKNKEVLTGGFLNTMDQMILSQQFVPPSDKAVQTFEIFMPILARVQKPDGSWVEGNQIKRPGAEREAAEVDTMWTVLALNSLQPIESRFSEETRTTLTRIRDSARTWLKEAKPGQRTDWFNLRLLLAKSEERPDEVTALRQELLSRQNADGGWYFLKDEGSHPHVTGEVMYALRATGLEHNHPALLKARQYLLSKQEKDGSWQVSSRRSRDKTYDITNYWGTCWATIGLLQTLPR